MTDNYEVGYRKPPKEHQFKKGKSGNPKGRPKKYLSGLSVLEAPVAMKVNGKRREVSAFEAAVRKTAQSAIEGRLPAIKRFFKHCDEAKLLIDRSRECRGGVWQIPIDIADYPDREFTDEQLEEIRQINRKAKEANERGEPITERAHIIKRVALERHFVESQRRQLTILDIVQLKLRHRALVERHEPSHEFFEKLLARTTPDIETAQVGFLVVSAPLPPWLSPLTVEKVEMDDPVVTGASVLSKPDVL